MKFLLTTIVSLGLVGLASAQVPTSCFRQFCKYGCWCDAEGYDPNDPVGTCPDPGVRNVITNPLDGTYCYEEYDPSIILSFKTTKDFRVLNKATVPKLEPKGCQPFPEVTAFLNDELGLVPPVVTCKEPATKDNSVCAYKVNCKKEKFLLKTFNNKKSAKQQGYTVAHEGRCGVCSYPSDLGNIIDENFDIFTYYCGLLIFGENNPLVDPTPTANGIMASLACFKGSIPGFPFISLSDDCAYLYVSNAIQDTIGSNTQFPDGCAQEGICLSPGLTWPPVFPLPLGNPPLPPQNPVTCDLVGCSLCDELLAGHIFQKYAGATRRSAGIVGTIKRDCDSVANLNHKAPCA
jgi:hypothetical protein